MQLNDEDNAQTSKFFYEPGDRVRITRMDEYHRNLGALAYCSAHISENVGRIGTIVQQEKDDSEMDALEPRFYLVRFDAPLRDATDDIVDPKDATCLFSTELEPVGRMEEMLIKLGFTRTYKHLEVTEGVMYEQTLPNGLTMRFWITEAQTDSGAPTDDISFCVEDEKGQIVLDAGLQYHGLTIL